MCSGKQILWCASVCQEALWHWYGCMGHKDFEFLVVITNLCIPWLGIPYGNSIWLSLSNPFCVVDWFISWRRHLALEEWHASLECPKNIGYRVYIRASERERSKLVSKAWTSWKGAWPIETASWQDCRDDPALRNFCMLVLLAFICLYSFLIIVYYLMVIFLTGIGCYTRHAKNFHCTHCLPKSWECLDTY